MLPNQGIFFLQETLDNKHNIPLSIVSENSLFASYQKFAEVWQNKLHIILWSHIKLVFFNPHIIIMVSLLNELLII